MHDNNSVFPHSWRTSKWCPCIRFSGAVFGSGCKFIGEGGVLGLSRTSGYWGSGVWHTCLVLTCYFCFWDFRLLTYIVWPQTYLASVTKACGDHMTRAQHFSYLWKITLSMICYQKHNVATTRITLSCTHEQGTGLGLGFYKIWPKAKLMMHWWQPV